MASHRRRAILPQKRRKPNGDPTLDMALALAGAAAAYFAVKMLMNKGSGGGGGGGGFDPKLIGGDGGGIRAEITAQPQGRTTPVVTPLGNLIVDPPPPTLWEPMRPSDAKFIKSHMNKIAAKIKKKDGSPLRLGPNNRPLSEDEYMDVNALKAFWVFMNIMWIANHLVGDDVLLGYKAPPAKYEAVVQFADYRAVFSWAAKFFNSPHKYNYVPITEHIGRARPSDYVVYKLASTTMANLTGAFSQKLIDYLRTVADVEPTPHDLLLMQCAYETYMDNPNYLKTGIFVKDYPPFPSPYPAEWPLGLR